MTRIGLFCFKIRRLVDLTDWQICDGLIDYILLIRIDFFIEIIF